MSPTSSAGTERPSKVDVSVVVPTAGKRPLELLAAVSSVRDQADGGVVELIVVDDSRGLVDRDGVVECAGRLPVTFVEPRPDVGQRSAGAMQAQGKWVAFLDDDDVWVPSKLRLQVAIAEEIESGGAYAVVSSRLLHTFAESTRTVPGVPGALIQRNQDVGSYLFHRRGPSVMRASMYTSTLLVSAELAKQVPWRRLPRHQDWDWLIRAGAQRNVQFAHHPDVLATIHVGSPASISAGSDWRASLDWAKEMRIEGLDRAAYADFLAAQVLRYALVARSVRGFGVVVREMVATRKIPTLRSLCVGLGGLVPRKTFQRLMAASSLVRRAQ
jgi:hypothetical protein